MKAGRIKSIAILCSAALIIALAVTLYHAVSMYQSQKNLNAGWHQYNHDLNLKVDLLNDLNRYMGYGGFIHNFKNYILRQEDPRASLTEEDINLALGALDSFETVQLTSDEALAVKNIRTTLLEYQQKLDMARALIKEGHPPSYIDKQVLVDDTYAIYSLNQLYLALEELNTSAMVTFGQSMKTTNQAIANIIYAAITLAVCTVIFVLFAHFLGQEMQRREVLENQLRQARDEAEAAAKAKSEFLATMSHEIRTPMNGVIGMSELLLAEHMEKKQRDMVETIKDSGEVLLRIINDILDFSKIEAGHVSIETQPLDIRRIAEDVITLLGPRGKEKGLEVNLECNKPRYPTLLGDPYRLKQVLLNLVGNAIKFTEQGHVTLHLQATVQNDGTWLTTFTIMDTGIGIPQEKLQTMFERFTQADSTTTRRFGGTGLGLAICKNLVELMNGTISLDSQPGKGSTFTVSLPLPLAVATASFHADPQFDLGDDPNQIVSKPLKILLAEDNKVNQVVAATLLSRLGHEVDIAEDGISAVNHAQQHDYDLIFMDWMMPRMDGLEATRLIRRQDTETPIIAMTANAMEGDREQCLEAGMIDYVSKPITREQLAEVLLRNNIGEPQS